MSTPADNAAESKAVEETKLENGNAENVSEKDADNAVDAPDDSANHLPMGPRLYLIVASLMLGVFCVALDNNIIAVAIPRITNQFHNLNHVGWYGSAYLLPGCGKV
jgi:hypothetical protein